MFSNVGRGDAVMERCGRILAIASWTILGMLMTHGAFAQVVTAPYQVVQDSEEAMIERLPEPPVPEESDRPWTPIAPPASTPDTSPNMTLDLPMEGPVQTPEDWYPGMEIAPSLPPPIHGQTTSPEWDELPESSGQGSTFTADDTDPWTRSHGATGVGCGACGPCAAGEQYAMGLARSPYDAAPVCESCPSSQPRRLHHSHQPCWEAFYVFREWEIHVGAVVLGRRASKSSPLAWQYTGEGSLPDDLFPRQDIAPNEFGEVLLNGNVDFGMPGGPRVQIGRWFDYCWAAEFVYFGVDNFVCGRARPGPAIFNGPQGTILGANPRVHIAGKLYNIEANLKMKISPHFSLLMGYRWLELSDSVKFHMDPLDLEDPFRQNSGDGFTESVDVINTLNGFQIGAELETLRWHGLWLQADMKAGIYENCARSRFDDEEASRGNSTGFVGGLSATLIWQPCDCLGVATGYEVLWIDPVAFAVNQLRHERTDSLASTNENGQGGLLFGDTALFHGVRITLCATW